MNKHKVLQNLVVFSVCILTLINGSIAQAAVTDERMNRDVINRGEVYIEEEFASEMAAKKENNVSFAENGKLIFDSIVYPAGIDKVEFSADGSYDKKYRYMVELKNSALFFGQTLEKMTGGKIRVIPDSEYTSGKAIFLKEDRTLDIMSQGFRLNIGSDAISITANSLQGITNGIYSFLEDKLGCMFAAEDFDYIPEIKTINLSAKEELNEPSIEWRNVYTYAAIRLNDTAFTKDYLGWHTKLRLNGAGNDDWMNWCHTSFTYISPDEYFDEHPEYFSLYRNKRVYEQGPVSGQLCWTNEEVYQIISEKVFKEMEENPDIHIWDVSQMDTWINRGVGCQCDNCKAIDDAEESQMGSLLTFINRLADDCKERYPDNYISTLAYNYSVKPPKNIIPRDNVIIKLCLMPGDNSTSFAFPETKDAQEGHDVVESWGKIAKHLLIWDYNVNFHNYLMPFPVIGNMVFNNDFYIENNTYGIFHQMDYDKGGQDARLHTYLYSKLMWDKDIDVEKLAGKYIDIYYGEAAPYIEEYYQAVHDNIQKYDQGMYIYAKPERYTFGYLSDKCLNQYMDIFDDALNAVKGDDELTARVEREMIGVLFAKAERFSFDKSGREEALEKMVTICKANEINALLEGPGDIIDEFYSRNLKEINAIPFIAAAILLTLVLIIVLIWKLGYILKKKRRKIHK